jgi:hypothetical protein
VWRRPSAHRAAPQEWREQGLAKGVYKGFWSEVARGVLFNAILMATKEVRPGRRAAPSSAPTRSLLSASFSPSRLDHLCPTLRPHWGCGAAEILLVIQSVENFNIRLFGLAVL